MVSLGLCCLLTLAAADPAPATPARPAKQENAALKYWQAFGLIPRFDDNQSRALDNGLSGEVEPTTVQVIEQCKDALAYLHKGAALRHCDWGLSFEDGAAVLMPHISKARELTQIALVRARYYTLQGKHTAAVDDLLATLTLARHVGDDGVLISLLVQFAIEARVETVAAEHLLGRLGPAARKRLAEGLDRLPAGGDFRTAMRAEKEYFLGAMKKQVGGSFLGLDRALQAVVLAAGGPKGTARLLDELAAHYDEVAALPADLPRKEFRARLAELNQKAEGNPFGKLLVPAMDKVLIAEERTLARRAMFRAALAILDGGPARVKDSRDPFGDGPFELRDTPDGFELRSKLLYQGTPVTLTVKRERKN